MPESSGGVRNKVIAAILILGVLGLGVMLWVFWNGKEIPFLEQLGSGNKASSTEGTPPVAMPSAPAEFPRYAGRPAGELDADPAVVQQSPAKYEQAKRELKDAAATVEEDPGQIEVWKKIAAIKHFYNDDIGARDAYEYVVKIWPNDPLVFFNLAVLYGYYLHENEKAIAAYESAIKLDPANASFYVGLGRFLAEGPKDLKKSEEVLMRGYGKVPGDVAILTALALLYRDLKEWGKAIEYYQKALATKDLSAGERAAIEAEVERLKQQ